MSTTTKADWVSEITMAKTLLRDLVTRYTRHHATLKIEGREMGAVLSLSLQAHRDDHPKLVGSKGLHIQALQTIFAAVGRRYAKTVRLTLLDPSIGNKMGPYEFIENPHWNASQTVALLKQILIESTFDGAKVEPLDDGALTTLVIRPFNVEDPAARWSDGAMERALHLLFHAIGKSEGRTIHVLVLDPKTGAPVHGTPV